MKNALQRTLTGINLHVMCSCGLKGWQAAQCAVAKTAIAQTWVFVSLVQVAVRVCSRWGAAYFGSPQLSHNVVANTCPLKGL